MPCDHKKFAMSNYLQPDWPAPSNIKAYCTTRRANSQRMSGYGNFNLALHVGDNAPQVEENRKILCDDLKLSHPPHWLNQTHSNNSIKITTQTPEILNADASYTSEKNKTCVVLTADCLPILLCNQDGNEVAALHCGWRGLYNGIIQQNLSLLKSKPEELIAWLGPAIGVTHYQVGADLRDKFISQVNAYADAFHKHNSSWYLDLNKLASIILNRAGVNSISGGEHCTYSNPDLFYSHRLEGPNTGRTASLIWIN